MCGIPAEISRYYSPLINGKLAILNVLSSWWASELLTHTLLLKLDSHHYIALRIRVSSTPDHAL